MIGIPLDRILFPVISMLAASVMLAGIPASAAEEITTCQGYKVIELRTSRLALYPESGGKPNRLGPKATKKFKHSRLPTNILACNFKKGMVQIRAEDGRKYWVKDYHVKTNKPLRKFRPTVATPSFSGPKLGGTRGYGSK